MNATPTRRIGPFRVREVGYAPRLRQPVHAHAEMGVTLVLRGAIRETVCTREEIGTSLSVVVKPAGVEHADEVGPRGAHTLQVLFDPLEVHQLLGDGHGLECWLWLHAGQAAGEMLGLLCHIRRAGTSCDAELEDRVLDVLGAVTASQPARGEPPRWIRHVREALDDEMSERVSVVDLARGAGTHAVSVSRAFRRHYGCSISEYRRRERLRRAAATIESSPLSLSRIAHGSGFADHAHLCRDFRALARLTPSDFRRLARESGYLRSSPDVLAAPS